MAGDLHSHTNFSDGSADIERMPVWARRAGLTHLAVSDHDSLHSLRWAKAHPVVEGVALLPAAELSCHDPANGRRVHILCYCPDETPALIAFCEGIAQRRNDLAQRSIARLEEMFPLFCREHALAYSARSGVTFKTHLMRELYDCGYTDAVYGALYHKLFDLPGGLIRHEPEYEDVFSALRMVRAARGVAVLAHPSVYRSMALAQKLAEQGLIDGVEIEHPRNTPEDKETLRAGAAVRPDCDRRHGFSRHAQHAPAAAGLLHHRRRQSCARSFFGRTAPRTAFRSRGLLTKSFETGRYNSPAGKIRGFSAQQSVFYPFFL